MEINGLEWIDIRKEWKLKSKVMRNSLNFVRSFDDFEMNHRVTEKKARKAE